MPYCVDCRPALQGLRAVHPRPARRRAQAGSSSRLPGEQQ
jgi:hypothetical protein